MPDAAYYRAWRAAHPEFRERQNQLRNERRRRLGRGDRSAEYARRRSRAGALSPIPALHTGHPLFDRARAIVGRRGRSGFTVLLDPLPEDLISEAVVALVAGSDPLAAVRRFHAAEIAWRRMIGRLWAAA